MVSQKTGKGQQQNDIPWYREPVC